ncbi:MAG: outer membrane lipoprotein-sorting protein [Bacteroidia bacterium]|nr:outer membrane lipoprotein-sorting protein [Bacteroidia bacterium]
MKTKLIILSLALFFSVTMFGQSAQEISEKSSDIIDITSMEMVSTLKIVDNKENVRERQITTASKKFGNVNKLMVKFISPADVAGTTLLVYDYEDQSDNMWIYMPALRKVRRIVSSEKGKNFMGSEFTNADMSKPNTSDFTYALQGNETIDGKECWKLEITPKTAALKSENGYSKRVAYIDKSNYFAYRIDFYNLSGKLNRIQTIKDYRKQSNGKYFAYFMEMKNVLNGRRSELKVDKFQAGSKLPESAFAPTAIEK